MENWILYALIFVVCVVFAAVVWVTVRRRKVAVEKPAVSVVKAPEASVPKLSEKMSLTRGNLLGHLERFLTRPSQQQLLDAEWDEVEEALLEADVGLTTANTLLTKVKERWGKSDGKTLRDLIREECERLLAGVHPIRDLSAANLPKPYIISIVGVNGVGKTTTIGKLAQRFTKTGKTVLLGAADTFRAGAISQLRIWAERVNAQFVTGREGGDPGAVAFDSATAAKARGIDIVLLDTAGRLHTKTNLMEELKKVHRVLKKVVPEAPHETWLVVDGTLGQNSIQQAKEFQKALELSGVILTKLDGTAKGGAVVGIASELGLPICFIGVGESAEDLMPFDPKLFTEAILG